MDWLFWLEVSLVVVATILLGKIILDLFISPIVWGVRKNNWLKKMVELDRANYIEDILDRSPTLSSLFGLAKSLGIYFKLQPDSFRCSEKKGYRWEANHITKEIRVAVDPKTLRIVPVDSWDQRSVMAHEIGHIISPNADFKPPCYQNTDFRRRCVLEDDASCLFRELSAEIEGKKILKRIFATNNNFLDVSSVIEAKHREKIDRLKKERCRVCWGEIAKGCCPKKEELCSFFS